MFFKEVFMKKMSLLVLVVAVIIALPGCGKKKESVKSYRKNSVAQYMNTEDTIEEIDFDEDNDDDEDDEDEEIDFDTDDTMDDLTEDELNSIDFDEIDKIDEMDEDEEFSWIDAQAD